MEQNLDLSTYELLSSYDKLILKKENELQKYFFENVKQEDMTGDIELPLIYSEDSDYAKLRRIKLKEKIKFYLLLIIIWKLIKNDFIILFWFIYLQ